jgi:hypothetical protein
MPAHVSLSKFMKDDCITVMRMNCSHSPRKACGEETGFYNSRMIRLDESVKYLYDQREESHIDKVDSERLVL